MDSSWMKEYEAKKGLLRPTCGNLEAYFTTEEICGFPVHQLAMGAVYFPTGELMAVDPLASMGRWVRPYFIRIPMGVYPLTTAVVETEAGNYRYAASRLVFSPEQPVTFINALKGNEDLGTIERGDFFGFDVEAGLAAILDVRTRDVYCNYMEKWARANPEANAYHDLFAAAFEQNYKENPTFQREGGDWINWRIPDTNLTIPMIQSGFGDGTYPAYFGLDKQGAICQFVVHFIDIRIEMVVEPEIVWG